MLCGVAKKKRKVIIICVRVHACTFWSIFQVALFPLRRLTNLCVLRSRFKYLLLPMVEKRWAIYRFLGFCIKMTKVRRNRLRRDKTVFAHQLLMCVYFHVCVCYCEGRWIGVLTLVTEVTQNSPLLSFPTLGE